MEEEPRCKLMSVRPTQVARTKYLYHNKWNTASDLRALPLLFVVPLLGVAIVFARNFESAR
jgi:hypothetical protein